MRLVALVGIKNPICPFLMQNLEVQIRLDSWEVPVGGEFQFVPENQRFGRLAPDAILP